jgi:hypothetical protein
MKPVIGRRRLALAVIAPSFQILVTFKKILPQ